MKTIKHKGCKIVPVKRVVYQVQDVSGRVLATKGSTSLARTWIDGYITMSDIAAKAVGTKAPKPRERKAKLPVLEGALNKMLAPAK